MWLTPDPIGVFGGVNLYRYVANNPVNFRDWLGLWEDDGDYGPARSGLSDESNEGNDDNNYAVASVAIEIDTPAVIETTLGWLARGWTAAVVEPTFVGEVVMVVATVAAVGYLGYIGLKYFAKQSKKSRKARATDTPTYTNYHDPQRPDETCGEYAERVLRDQFGSDDPRANKRGRKSAYSQIKKNCERGS